MWKHAPHLVSCSREVLIIEAVKRHEGRSGILEVHIGALKDTVSVSVYVWLWPLHAVNLSKCAEQMLDLHLQQGSLSHPGLDSC